MSHTNNRAKIRIEFCILGQISVAVLQMNYTPENGEFGLDARVRDFFEKSYKKAAERKTMRPLG